jgi:serine/threonine protein phosphatase 1
MSDLHGCYNEFIKMLELIKFSKEDKLYILGDVIDRGKDSIKLLRYIMSQNNIELLIGNHCDMMIKSLVKKDSGYYNCWMNNGGNSTLKQFDELCLNNQNEILTYLQNRPLYEILDKFILVHAGIDPSFHNVNVAEFMKLQDEETLLWVKDEFINCDLSKNDLFKEYTVIFGHSPTYPMQNIKPMTIWHSIGKIGIDCGVCFSGGQLGCLRLDDMKEFYV